ncbi:MAG TPA: glycoside hydrolase family 6 protein [Longimicrobium sp.]|nr:glycoside hydrolase family 6 protein [Longimicrobium sp.]
MTPHSPERPGKTRRGRWLAARLGLPVLVGVAFAAPSGAGQANPFAGKRLYVDPGSHARVQADAWARSRPRDAALMRVIAEQPQAIWIGDWVRDPRREVDARVSQAASAGALPVFVVYNIPYRDCGLYSAGGARGGDAYRRWIISFSQGLRRRPAVVILEPDGLPSLDCLPARFQDERYVLLREAVQTLSAGGASVYIDAGNANWRNPSVMTERLRKAGIELATGFSLNVSNFHGLQANVAYGERLSRLVGGKHFVIDTSRNGRGAAVEREWCNAPNQALGRAPTTRTGHPLIDAFLWVKTPGQSDGTCNGGPRAGAWWAEYALELSRAAQALGSLSPR